MTAKDYLIVLAIVFLIWLLFGGIFSSNTYYDDAPEGIEDYNSPPSNPYGN